MSYIGSTPTTQSFIAGTDYFNGTGSAVSFTMSRAVNSVNDIEVIVNNVEQIPSGYSVSGTTLTFSAAPSAGTSNVYVRYLSTTNLSLAIPAGTSATFNTVAATTLSVTGVTTFAAGTAALPAITTTGDTNTGIFFPAADTIAFAEGGVEAVRIDSSGNLLVATTSAAGKLNVAGQVTATGGLFKANGAPSLSAATAGEAILAPDSGSGALLYGRGTNYDVAICQRSTAVALGVLAGSTNVHAVGDVFIKRTTTYSYANGGLCAEGTGGNPCIVAGTAGTTSYNNMVFGNGNGGVGSISTNGSATAFNTSSDYRLKEAISPMTGALAKVALLKPCTYKWKVDGTDGQGFIAHELDEVVSGCVTGEKDAVDADGKPQYQGIDTSFLVATLTAAIQEQQALITALTTRITALENNNATQ